MHLWKTFFFTSVIISIITVMWFVTISLDSKVWIQRAMPLGMGCGAKEFDQWVRENPMDTEYPQHDYVKDFLISEGITVYDSKTEFKKELRQLCEATCCKSGEVRMYLISINDIEYAIELGFGRTNPEFEHEE